MRLSIGILKLVYLLYQFPRLPWKDALQNQGGCSRACTLRIEELPADADKLHERLYVLGIREQWQAWFKCQPSEHRAFVLSIAALEEWKIVHSLVP